MTQIRNSRPLEVAIRNSFNGKGFNKFQCRRYRQFIVQGLHDVSNETACKKARNITQINLSVENFQEIVAENVTKKVENIQ